MTDLLTGKTILITGASSGIGEAAAHLFVREGANVVVTARRTAELERVAGGHYHGRRQHPRRSGRHH